MRYHGVVQNIASGVFLVLLTACIHDRPINNNKFAHIKSDINPEIERLVNAVKTEQVPFVREVLAGQIEELTPHRLASDINANAIAAIASLLEDDDDIVRLWAAKTLGIIGPTAKSALPALRQALEKEKLERKKCPYYKGIDSQDTIREAITQISTQSGLDKKLWLRRTKSLPPTIADYQPILSSDDISLSIERFVREIKDEPSEWREYIAEQLPRIIAYSDISQIDAKAINTIIFLLDDEDESVRLSAANALGGIGPRAKQALPRIRIMLGESERWAKAQRFPVELIDQDMLRADIDRISR